MTTQQTKALAAWQAIASELDSPDVELDVETFAVLLSRFIEARRAGIAFDPAFVALMNVLRRQAFGTDADSDCDRAVDDGQELDDVSASPGGMLVVRQAA